mgnify:CR=1 FL=1
MKDDLLPYPRIDPNYPSLPRFSINSSTDYTRVGDSNNNLKPAVSPVSKRRRLSDADYMPAKRIPTEPLTAKRPDSLSISMPNSSVQSKNPGTPSTGSAEDRASPNIPVSNGSVSNGSVSNGSVSNGSYSDLFTVDCVRLFSAGFSLTE